jgi:hypothetical protein
LHELDAALELEQVRRQDVVLELADLALGFELGHELRAAVDLNAFDELV